MAALIPKGMRAVTIQTPQRRLRRGRVHPARQQGGRAVDHAVTASRTTPNGGGQHHDPAPERGDPGRRPADRRRRPRTRWTEGAAVGHPAGHARAGGQARPGPEPRDAAPVAPEPADTDPAPAGVGDPDQALRRAAGRGPPTRRGEAQESLEKPARRPRPPKRRRRSPRADAGPGPGPRPAVPEPPRDSHPRGGVPGQCSSSDAGPTAGSRRRGRHAGVHRERPEPAAQRSAGRRCTGRGSIARRRTSSRRTAPPPASPGRAAVLGRAVAADPERALAAGRRAGGRQVAPVLAVGPADRPAAGPPRPPRRGRRLRGRGGARGRLAAALGRVRRVAGRPAEPARTIAVLAPSGGSGSSTLAVNVATVLAKEHKTALLIDLKLQAGDLAALLDLKPTHTLADLCQNVARHGPDHVRAVAGPARQRRPPAGPAALLRRRPATSPPRGSARSWPGPGRRSPTWSSTSTTRSATSRSRSSARPT